TTQCCSTHNSVCNLRSSFSNCLRFILVGGSSTCCLDMGFSRQYLISRCYQSTGQGVAFQIPVAYSAIVRSLENFPEHATLIMDLRANASGSAYSSPTRCWAWAYEVRSAKCM